MLLPVFSFDVIIYITYCFLTTEAIFMIKKKILLISTLAALLFTSAGCASTTNNIVYSHCWDTNTEKNIEIEAGLYDTTGNLLVSYSELKLDVSKDYELTDEPFNKIIEKQGSENTDVVLLTSPHS
jgi:hypothetical protein